MKVLKELEPITHCYLGFNPKELLSMKTKITKVTPLIMTFRVTRKDSPFLFSSIQKSNTKMLLNRVSTISKKYALFPIIYEALSFSFLPITFPNISFPKYINCFQSADFFITACSMLVTASFLYWILDWTSILNLTRTMIAHIKQIKAANLFLETILHLHYRWGAP